ncbi:hypothetical protein GCM10027174_25570 [Salinifilum aidingensis]
MFIIAVTVLTVLLVGCVIFTDLVDQDGSVNTGSLRRAADQVLRAVRALFSAARPR